MKQKLAQNLIEIGAFKISNDPYTWASGIKSPFYCDNRLLLSYPAYWQLAIDELIKLAQREFQFDALAGVATAGIPHAAAMATKLKLPLAYVRSQAKGHGKQNRLEGKLSSSAKVLVVEDLISTGGSVLEAVECLQSMHLAVVGVVSLFSYGMKQSREKLSQLKFKSLIGLEDLLATYQVSKSEQVLIDQFQSEYR